MTVTPTIPQSQVGLERQSPGSGCVKLPRAGSSRASSGRRGRWRVDSDIGRLQVVVVLMPVAAYSGDTGICKVRADS